MISLCLFLRRDLVMLEIAMTSAGGEVVTFCDRQPGGWLCGAE
jgi:hypothetical protein